MHFLQIFMSFHELLEIYKKLYLTLGLGLSWGKIHFYLQNFPIMK